jgi:thioredoxin-related protein
MHRWTWVIGLALIIVLGTDAAAAANESAGPIKWIRFDEAHQQNTKQLKIMIFFHADWCKYCHKLEKNAFADQEIADYINAHFLPVRIDTEKDRNTTARFGVRGLPDIRFLTPGGEGIARIPGYVEGSQLLMLLKFISTDSYKSMSIKDFSAQLEKK